MPTAALRYCATPRCPVKVQRGHCAQHSRVREQQRPNVDIRRLYHTAAWQALRLVVLQEEPFCMMCEAEGRMTMNTDVDHIRPHRGDVDLFWDRANLQGLCHTHHTRKTNADGSIRRVASR